VLIEGESGTGKELVARAIHRLGSRGGGPFVCENCAALPEHLFESECFGHEKGAFTGAVQQKAGLFERARSGTVFLDEVGELHLTMQRKLLRVLQEKQVRRVGGQDAIAIDFRVISATNRDLEAMVGAGAFRKDLYFRLNVSTILVPPLRDRPEDIPLLVHHFASLTARELGREPLILTAGALDAICRYRWPGNIRELRNEILRLACTGQLVADAHSLSPRVLRSLRQGEARAAQEVRPLSEVEREAILAAMRASRGNRSETARRLQITRSSLYRKLERYGLLFCMAPEAAALQAEAPGNPRGAAQLTPESRRRARSGDILDAPPP